MFSLANTTTDFDELCSDRYAKFVKLCAPNISITHNCCYTAEEVSKIEMRDVIYSVCKKLATRLQADVREGMENGDADDCIELAIRYSTGNGTTVGDEYDALKLLWSLVAEPSTYKFKPTVAQRGQAYSVMSHIHWTLRLDKSDRMDPNRDPGKETWLLWHVYMAGSFADDACKLGYVSGQIIMIAMALETCGLRHESDPLELRRMRKAGLIGDIRKFTALWEVWDAACVKSRQNMKEMEYKIKTAPHAYACARPGCAVYSDHRVALRRCGGKCLREIKPAYCSKECQVQDWKRHKPHCGPTCSPDPRILYLKANPPTITTTPPPGSTIPMAYHQQLVDSKSILDYSPKTAQATNVLGKDGTTTAVRATPSNIQDVLKYGGTLDEYQEKVEKEEMQRSRARVEVIRVGDGLRVRIS